MLSLLVSSLLALFLRGLDDVHNELLPVMVKVALKVDPLVCELEVPITGVDERPWNVPRLDGIWVFDEEL